MKTRKYRCWKVGNKKIQVLVGGKQGNLGVENKEIQALEGGKQGNTGVGRWERRKYRCWKVGNKEM